MLSPEERAKRLAWPTFDGYCGLHGSGPECGHAPEERRKRRVYAEKIVADAIREAVEAEREAIAKTFDEKASVCSEVAKDKATFPEARPAYVHRHVTFTEAALIVRARGSEAPR